jgi:hypothetical protein
MSLPWSTMTRKMAHYSKLMQRREKWQSEKSRTKSEMAAKKNRNENTACMMLMIRPRCTTKCVSRAERRYALRPCHSRHRVACENCASDTSAASEACCPSCAGFERGRVRTSAGKTLMLGTGFSHLGTVLRLKKQKMHPRKWPFACSRRTENWQCTRTLPTMPKPTSAARIIDTSLPPSPIAAQRLPPEYCRARFTTCVGGAQPAETHRSGGRLTPKIRSEMTGLVEKRDYFSRLCFRTRYKYSLLLDPNIALFCVCEEFQLTDAFDRAISLHLY